MVKKLVVCAAILIAISAGVFVFAERTKTPTAYDTELAQLRASLQNASPAKAALQQYRIASLTGDYAEFARAEAAIDRALKASPSPEMHLLKAHFEFTMHRLPRAQAELALLNDAIEARTLAADIAYQRGRTDEARRAYEAVIEEDRTWENLARLAYLEGKSGNQRRADALYAAAQDELSAKEMRAFAWIELQRGLLDLDAKRYSDALAHYQRANRAWSGWWLIEEHIAEVLALMGRKSEAIERYDAIVEKTKNPEFISALATLRNDPALYAEADRLFAERMKLYPEAAGAHFVEHLIDRPGVDPRMVPLAEQNFALRPNAEAKELLERAREKTSDH